MRNLWKCVTRVLPSGTEDGMQVWTFSEIGKIQPAIFQRRKGEEIGHFRTMQGARARGVILWMPRREPA